MGRRPAGLRVAAALILAIATMSSSRVVQGATPATRHEGAAPAAWPKNVYITAMTCPGIALCFAAGGYAGGRGLIAQTEDGGTSWTIQYRDRRTGFLEIACPGRIECYATGVYARGSYGVGTIFRTRDGGKSWQQSPAPFQTTTRSTVGYGIACPAVTTCLIPAITFGHSASAIAKVETLLTGDRGRTWRKTPIGALASCCPPPTSACPTRQLCYLYGPLPSAHGTSSQGTAVMRSGDGGKAWRMLAGTNMLARIGVHQYYDTAMSLACPGANVCYTADGMPKNACGDPGDCGTWTPFGAIFRTLGGGVYWRLLYKAGTHEYLLGPIVCPSASVCYEVGGTIPDAGGGQFILSTRNGGQSWTRHPVPAGLRLACPSTDVCYLAARSGPTFFRTMDGGRTWKTLP